ncbi:MAG: hypothetical protein NC548_06400 [Lachnospiraceae bacterium]|nr:hypothetical protein [Lachnospiraceae bacterium]
MVGATGVTAMNAILIIVVITASLVLLGILGLCGYMLLHSSTQKQAMTPEEFINLLAILNSIVDARINDYENSIFDGLNNKGSITNNNFDNYYREMTETIIADIPDSLIAGLENYYTESAIIKFIGRKVRDYLVSKIKVNTGQE